MFLLFQKTWKVYKCILGDIPFNKKPTHVFRDIPNAAGHKVGMKCFKVCIVEGFENRCAPPEMWRFIKGALFKETIFDLICKLEMDTSNNGYSNDGTVCSYNCCYPANAIYIYIYTYMYICECLIM